MATLYDSGMTGDMANSFYGTMGEEDELKKRKAAQVPPAAPAQPQPTAQAQPAPPQRGEPAQPAPQAPKQTFAQMQQAGYARPNPPAPAPAPVQQAPAPAQVSPYTGQTPVLTAQAPAATQPVAMPPAYTQATPAASGAGLDIGAELARQYQQGGISPEVAQGISAAIANPSAYNSQLVRDIYGQLGQNIDDEFAQRETALREEMAGRGLSDSSIQGGRLADLNVGRRSARQGLANQLGQMVAQDYAGARDRALGMGMARDQYGNQLGQSYLDRLMGFGQQAFQNDMTQAEFNRALQNDQDRMMMAMFGLGG